MTMAFHIFFALFGVGIPLIISLAELTGIVKKDAAFTAMARRWTFAMATLFVAGAISGTIIAVVFAVLLPPFMAFISKVVILPFYMETFAFFIEAIFLGIYAYTWDTFKSRWTHWLTSLPIVMGSLASAFFITTVNAFMTAPQGFTYQNGVVSHVDQWRAMWNAAVPTRTGHSILSYYATTAFVFAAVAAGQFLWNKKKAAGEAGQRSRRKMMAFSLLLAFIFSLAVVVTGDSSARYIASNEPEKFAAAEAVMHTEANAPFVIAGVRIPDALSFLVGGSVGTVVKGLDAFDPTTWPPLIIHYFFDGMVVIGILMAFVPILFFLSWRYHPRRAFHGVLMWLVFVTGILSVVGVELGWMLTEIGRQPYVIQGIMLTKDAFTSSPAVVVYAVAFPIFYIVLAIVTGWILKTHYRERHD